MDVLFSLLFLFYLFYLNKKFFAKYFVDNADVLAVMPSDEVMSEVKKNVIIVFTSQHCISFIIYHPWYWYERG